MRKIKQTHIVGNLCFTQVSHLAISIITFSGRQAYNEQIYFFCKTDIFKHASIKEK